ncbi:MAG: hypothetical protein RLZZ138_85 [Actinomycetota bacterium]|jgi:hypothetical protein
MRLLPIVIAPVLAISLTGCSVEDVAKTAADAAACTAMASTLDGLTEAYNAGLVDSGVIATLDELVGDQARSLLSSTLAQDIADLGAALGETSTAASAQEKVATLTASINERCSAVGVSIGE